MRKPSEGSKTKISKNTGDEEEEEIEEEEEEKEEEEEDQYPTAAAAAGTRGARRGAKQIIKNM